MQDQSNQPDHGSLKDYGVWFILIILGSVVTEAFLNPSESLVFAVGSALGILALPGLVLIFTKKKDPKTRVTIFAVIWAAVYFVVLSGRFSPSSKTATRDLEEIFQPAGCDYSVVFDAEPDYYTRQKALADGSLVPLHGAELIVSGGRGLTRSECAAVEYDMESVTRDAALTMMQQIALDMGLSRPDFAFEILELGRVATITGTKDTERGRIIVRIINYHGPGSIMTLYISSLSADFQTTEMTSFGRSIRLN